MNRGQAANRYTRNLRATRGGVPGSMARQMENLGIALPQASGSPNNHPVLPSPGVSPVVSSPSILPELPRFPNRGLIRIVTAKELAEGSMQPTLGAPSFFTHTLPSTSSSKSESSMLCLTSKCSSLLDRPIDDTLRIKDPALSTPAPIKMNSLKELIDYVFAENMSDIQSLTISMILKDGNKLVINAEV